MLNLATSFWLQIGVAFFLVPAVILAIRRACNHNLSWPASVGIGCIISGGLLFLITLAMLEHTSSGGRGWGSLIFVYVLFGEALLAGVGVLSIIYAAAARLYCSICKKIKKNQSQTRLVTGP